MLFPNGFLNLTMELYAMNKGITMATGEIVGILNSDDFYHNETVIESWLTSF